MSMSTGERFAILGTLGGAALLAWQSAWPDWQRAETRQAQIVELERKVGEITQAEESLSAQTQRLSQARKQRDRECRSIPHTADVAGLMQALSLEVNGDVVRDQTFTVMDLPRNSVGSSAEDSLEEEPEIKILFCVVSLTLFAHLLQFGMF